MEKIKVIQYGVGAMGSEMVKLMLKKEGFEIVGAIDVRNVGNDLGEVLGIGKRLGITISNNPDEVFAKTKADVALYATVTHLEELFPQIEKAIRAKVNVIGIGEELANPYYHHFELAQRIDKLAKEYEVSVLGTGTNPGFIFDTFIITLTGVCKSVTKIKASRVIDYSPFGPIVMKHFGFGLTEDEFKRGLADGSVTLLISLSASVSMIADSLGLELNEIREDREPIISKTFRETPYIKVEPGKAAGFKQKCCGIRDGEEAIALEYIGLIRPEIEGVETNDSILVEGEPNINLSIKPAIDGAQGTVGIAVNMIPKVINARSGLLTMKDLPIPSAILGDVRKTIK